MGYDHATVTIHPRRKDLSDHGSLKFSLPYNSSKFVRDYSLKKSSSEYARKLSNIALRVTIEGDYEMQKEYYISNNPTLIDALRNQDYSKLITPR
ncbi:hypothetical protein LX73_0161 [Fodinibius salinus]|uniref:Uncharacterized protein n=1 Tax=Fodinibius salinus TaxID=860790 RepID=A0A5D3YQN3_9BACT|nr:hypothetical protein [Fodinibius salinus]TYP94871.1 hypothetical protein LX73_0161 [Fodinibius salinus]